MSSVSRELHTIDLTRSLWKNRKNIAQGWHGFGIVEDANAVKKLTLYADSKSDIQPLTDLATSIRTDLPIDIMQIPRFQYCSVTPSAPQTPRPGDGVFSVANTCGHGPTGTITAFLKFTDPQENDPILLLSACHVLARDRGCRQNLVVELDATSQKISNLVHPVELLAQGNTVDAAVAELIAGTSVNPQYPIIQVKSFSPQRPSAGDPVEKFGNASRETNGKLLFYCPKIEVIPGPGIGSVEFEDQMLIVSADETKPFVMDGDSGALLVSNGIPAGMVIAKSQRVTPAGQSNPDPGDVDGRYALASPLDAVLEQISNILGRSVEIMAPPAITSSISTKNKTQPTPPPKLPGSDIAQIHDS